MDAVYKALAEAIKAGADIAWPVLVLHYVADHGLDVSEPEHDEYSDD